MSPEEYARKMGGIKKCVLTAFILSAILSLAMIVLLICFNFAGVFTIQTLPGTKYENAFTYPGWQAIYWGVGEMIIQGYTEFSFNIWNCLGLFLPLLVLIVCEIIYLKNRKKRGTNTKKAVLEFIMAGAVLFGSIILFNCDYFAIENAKTVTGSYQNYYTEYLYPALNGEVSFSKEIYPYLILIAGLLTTVVKAVNGALLIYQKKFAAKYGAK